MIIPSIDIQNGKVVQLRLGRERVLTDPRDPIELARYFGRFGPVAVIDLDAAMDAGSNAALLAACCQVARCRVGGGIRSEEAVKQWIRRGAEKVIIGTAATPEFLRTFPRDWLIAAIDARDGEVVVEGWRKGTARPVGEAAEILAPWCSELLYTCVEREGMLGGAAVEEAIALRGRVSVPVTVAGGIVSVEEIRRLIDAGCHVQLGRAVYEGRIDLPAAWADMIRYDDHGLVPTIVQDAVTGDVRMLAYSSRESLRTALSRGEGWYYSRRRQKLWRKGESSGNTQKLLAARWDCDRDTALFQVLQRGPTCHTGRDNCFQTVRRDVFSQLAGVLAARASDGSGGGYTQRLLGDPPLMHSKLREEIEEVIAAEGVHEVAWEAADVVYHLLVYALSRGVTLDRIGSELRSRMV